jgi:copper(I)-binding protein
MKRRFLILCALLPSIAWAHSSKLGNIAIGHSWAFPSAGLEAQVMMPLINLGEAEDQLIAAETPLTEKAELRGGDFILAPKKPFSMRAAAKHIALIHLVRPLVIGDVFPLTLTFKNAGKIEIQIHVSEKPGD